MGGENLNHLFSSVQIAGPSPRGWGEQRDDLRAPVVRRTIPTWVGRTVFHRFSVFRHADHPHVGGENPEQFCKTGVQRGPSPRGWGEQRTNLGHAVIRRTIPTWVGRTQAAEERPRLSADHPHVGGENATGTRMTQVFAGPSPRGWGELCCEWQEFDTARTIPTWVGRTLFSTLPVVHLTDHPHVGGENTDEAIQARADRGPSPRGWGERVSSVSVSSSTRTIPTWVGRTVLRLPVSTG